MTFSDMWGIVRSLILFKTSKQLKYNKNYWIYKLVEVPVIMFASISLLVISYSPMIPVVTFSITKYVLKSPSNSILLPCQPLCSVENRIKTIKIMTNTVSLWDKFPLQFLCARLGIKKTAITLYFMFLYSDLHSILV